MVKIELVETLKTVRVLKLHCWIVTVFGRVYGLKLNFETYKCAAIQL